MCRRSTRVYLPAPASRKPVHYCLPYGKSSSCLASDPLDDCLLALSHRFHRILPQKSRSDLREIKAKHCQHRGQAIWYLKDKIGNLDKCRTDKTLVGVMMLLFSDAIYYDHFNAALEMIPLRGGVEKLLYSAAHLKALLLYFMTNRVISNTTSFFRPHPSWLGYPVDRRDLPHVRGRLLPCSPLSTRTFSKYHPDQSSPTAGLLASVQRVRREGSGVASRPDHDLLARELGSALRGPRERNNSWPCLPLSQ